MIGDEPGHSESCLETVMREHDLDRALADLPAEFLLDERLQIRLIVDEQNGDAHAACPSLVSISWRSSEKSIGLVNRPSAPRSIAFFLVSASP